MAKEKRKAEDFYTADQVEELAGGYKNTDNIMPADYDLSDAGERDEMAENQAERTK
ncbi:hypothetical protein JOD45_000008 [Scopulibacillus daqui]|uniref:Uncharacterized protein n=1 Tax=Scopulibacillus daqui TaxID=1469162 RepID=A0ABS2PUT8_9BACL|nr:hypothetical protein [Scopulibacillus daqui]MBM7643817.1 hypothetical protein [Scopulibacillus daqui]